MVRTRMPGGVGGKGREPLPIPIVGDFGDTQMSNEYPFVLDYTIWPILRRRTEYS